MLNIESSGWAKVSAEMNKFAVRNNRRSVHGRALCWAARIISLLPGLAAAYDSRDTVIWAAKYGNVGDIFQTASMWFALLVLPGLIAWRWHLAGSVLLAVPALMLVFVPFTSEIDRSYGLLCILPLGLALFAGAFINLMVWVWEVEGSRGPRQT
jgi:hypothetical protein